MANAPIEKRAVQRREAVSSHDFCSVEGMLERIFKLSVVILLIGFAMPGCAYLSKSGRQQMAYERYVRKCSHRRDVMRSKIKTPAIPPYFPSENKVATQVAGSPQSVSSGESQAEQ
jgi:hypothetical protein